MSGKILVSVILAVGLVTAASVWYLQVFYYYETVDAGLATIEVTPMGGTGGAPALMRVRNYRAIDANSSPIRYRACFDEGSMLIPNRAIETARANDEPYPDADPLNAPFWFDCFDAEAIGTMLEDGTASAFLGTRNYAYGVDRIVAITEDGRGYVWHQLNNCGDVDYTGTPTGEACPPREETD